MTIHNRLAPTLIVRAACVAGLTAWFCLLIGTWMKWREEAGNTVWDFLFSVWLFFGSLPNTIIGGPLWPAPPLTDLVLEMLCLVLAALAVLGARRGSKERAGKLTSLTLGLGIALLVLAVGSLSLHAIIWLWLKDSSANNWR